MQMGGFAAYRAVHQPHSHWEAVGLHQAGLGGGGAGQHVLHNIISLGGLPARKPRRVRWTELTALQDTPSAWWESALHDAPGWMPYRLQRRAATGRRSDRASQWFQSAPSSEHVRRGRNPAFLCRTKRFATQMARPYRDCMVDDIIPLPDTCSSLSPLSQQVISSAPREPSRQRRDQTVRMTASWPSR